MMVVRGHAGAVADTVPTNDIFSRLILLLAPVSVTASPKARKIRWVVLDQIAIS